MYCSHSKQQTGLESEHIFIIDVGMRVPNIGEAGAVYMQQDGKNRCNNNAMCNPQYRCSERGALNN